MKHIFTLFLLFICACENKNKIQSSQENPSVIYIKDPQPIVPPNDYVGFIPPLVNDKLGNSDKCQDSDQDGTCDNLDRCPNFDDSIDNDRDLSPKGCDCDDNDPSVFPGGPCLDRGIDDKCTFRICDDNLSGQCIPKFRPQGAVCDQVLKGICDAEDVCDGNGTCLDKKRVGITCRRQAGACDIAEQCDGINDQCPTDVYAPMGSVCGLDNLGTCRGDGTCNRVNPCPSSINQTDNDGDNWTIDCDCDDNNPNIFPGRPCQSDGLECTFDICSPEATGVCLHEPLPTNFICGSAPMGDCDAQDTCNSSSQCIDNIDPATFICRNSDHQCDSIEYCDGINKICPSNSFVPVGTLCGAAPAGDCDTFDSCDAQGNCVNNYLNSSTVCRVKQGECDLAENCTGSSPNCPTDSKESDGTSCGPAISGDCDLADSCLAGVCFNNVKPNSTICRGSINSQPPLDYQCDPAEYCDGTNSQCPIDIISPNGETSLPCVYEELNGCLGQVGNILCINGAATCYDDVNCERQSVDSDNNLISLLGTSVSIDGYYAIAGAPFDTNNNGLITGSVSTFVYNELSKEWQFQTTLPVPVNDFSKLDIVADASQGIGKSVATLAGFNLVGAPDVKVESAGLGSDKSAGALFSYLQGQLSSTIFSPHSDDRANFGQSVAIDGLWVAVGDSGSNFCGYNGAGEVLMYQYNPTFNSLTYRQSLCASDANVDDQLGYATAISNDWLIASAYSDDTANHINVGSVYFFRFNPLTNLWEQKQKFLPTNPNNNDLFGYSVDIDENVAVVGVPYDDTNVGNDAGTISIFRFNGSNWILENTEIQSPAPSANAIFGNGVAVEGNVILSGQPFQPYQTILSPQTGSAFIYTYTGSWNFYGQLFGEGTSDTFGTDVDISGDWLMVGSPASAGAPLNINLRRIKFYYFPYNSAIQNSLP